MKLNRFFAMAAIALLAVGAMGTIASRSFALGSQNPVAGVSVQAQACAQDQADGTEVKSATDTDSVDLQCGDQNAADASVGSAADKGGQAAVSAAANVSLGSAALGGLETTVSTAADTDNVQVEEQVGDQSGPDTGVEAPEAAPAIK